MAETAVKSCSCRSDFQDKRYGTGMRVHNKKEKASTPTFTCTVCAKQKQGAKK